MSLLSHPGQCDTTDLASSTLTNRVRRGLFSAGRSKESRHKRAFWRAREPRDPDSFQPRLSLRDGEALTEPLLGDSKPRERKGEVAPQPPWRSRPPHYRQTGWPQSRSPPNLRCATFNRSARASHPRRYHSRLTPPRQPSARRPCQCSTSGGLEQASAARPSSGDVAVENPSAFIGDGEPAPRSPHLNP